MAIVHAPPVVVEELRRHTGRSIPGWLLIHPLSLSSIAKSAAWREAGLADAGEADALALALEIDCNWFLTDDAGARLLGESLGLEVHGSLGGGSLRRRHGIFDS